MSGNISRNRHNRHLKNYNKEMRLSARKRLHDTLLPPKAHEPELTEGNRTMLLFAIGTIAGVLAMAVFLAVRG